MSNLASKTKIRERRHGRIRARVTGTDIRPRLSVYRSNRYISAQIIDDEKGVTVASASSKGRAEKSTIERARAVGKDLAKKAIAAKIKQVVFDRGGFLYAGSVRELAEGAREGGLSF